MIRFLLRCLLYVGLVISTLTSCQSNPAVDYAAQGRNQKLLEVTQQQGVKSTADQHQLCYALLQTKRYAPLATCLDDLERRINAGDRRTRLFGLEDATPAVWIMRAEMQLELGRSDAALEQAQRALNWIERTKEQDRWVLLSALSAATLAAQRVPDISKASNYLQALEKVSVSYPLYHNHATTKSLALARAYMSVRQYDKVLQALQADSSFEWRAAVSNVLSTSQEDRWAWQRLPRLYMTLRALQETGASAEALRGYQQLLTHPALPENFEIHWRVLAEAATLSEKAGQVDKAASLYAQAIALLELFRGNTDTEINKVGEHVNRAAIYDRYVALLFRQGKTTQAQEIAERKNGFSLVKLLAGIPSLEPRQKNLAATTQQASQALAQAELAALIQDNAANLSSASTRQDQLRAAQQKLKQSTDAETASLMVVSDADKTAIAKRLSRGESVLQLHGDGKVGHSWLWLAGRDAPIVREFDDANALELTQRVRTEFKKLSDTKKFDFEQINQRLGQITPALKNLYDQLIGDHIERYGIKQLTIIPHGDLHYLPFHALRGKNSYLSEMALVRILPNMQTMKFLESKPDIPPHEKSLVMTYAPASHPLPTAEEEVAEISKHLPRTTLHKGNDATLTQFKRQDTELMKYIHLVAHGVFDEKHPLESHLVLKQDAQSNGKLTVKELYGLQINTDLITLSACVTAQGQLSADGKDVVGLVQGAFKAGSRHVMASLWEVDDEATTDLMIAFYQNRTVLIDNVAALQRAQKAVRQKFPHPYFWAAMQIYG